MTDKPPHGAPLEALRWLAPLVSLIVLTPVTIVTILTSSNDVLKIVLGAGTLALIGLMAWRWTPEFARRGRQNLDRLIDERITAQLQPFEQLSGQIRHFQAQEAYRYLSSQYGWGYTTLDVLGTLDRNGAMLLQRNVTVHALRQLNVVEQSLHVRPKLAEKNVSYANVRVFDPTRRARLGEINPLPDGWVAKVQFEPGLRADERVTFTIQEDIPAETYRFNVPAEDIAAADDKFDWVAWRIDRPIERLSLKVEFPRRWAPQEGEYALRVFYQPLPNDPDKGRQHDDEQKRLNLSLVRADTGEARLMLDVEYPILGLIYMIRWNPPLL